MNPKWTDLFVTNVPLPCDCHGPKESLPIPTVNYEEIASARMVAILRGGVPAATEQPTADAPTANCSLPIPELDYSETCSPALRKRG